MKAQSQRIENKKYIEDIIRSLPDCLICQILSFLPTQDAIITSVLSSRWRPFWTLVPTLDLDYFNLVRNKNAKFRFVDKVSNIWTLCNTIPLCKFCLQWTWPDCDLFYVDTLVRATIPCGVQELNLHIYITIAKH